MQMIAALTLTCLMLLASCGTGHRTTNEVVAVTAPAIPLDPAAAAWNDAPEHLASLILQDLVEPRLMTPSTSEVRVRALTNGAEVAFRLEWDDPQKDDMPGPGRFVDSCAIQLPAAAGPEPPAPQMGEGNRSVEIAFWRADWQAAAIPCGISTPAPPLTTTRSKRLLLRKARRRRKR